MAYQSLYRRYRPQRFDEVKGQDHVTRTLRNSVREGRVSHAYLFSGPRGTGKTSTARILAKALNCPNVSEGEPCGECESCVAITEGRSLDVVEMDAASNRGIDAVVGRGVELDGVEAGALLHRVARVAHAAGLAVVELLAVEGLGEDAGGGGLARAPRPAEQVAMADPGLAHGVAQRHGDVVLPEDLLEPLRPEPAIEGLVRRVVGTVVGGIGSVGHGQRIAQRYDTGIAGRARRRAGEPDPPHRDRRFTVRRSG